MSLKSIRRSCLKRTRVSVFTTSNGRAFYLLLANGQPSDMIRRQCSVTCRPHASPPVQTIIRLILITSERGRFERTRILNSCEVTRVKYCHVHDKRIKQVKSSRSRSPRVAPTETPEAMSRVQRFKRFMNITFMQYYGKQQMNWQIREQLRSHLSRSPVDW